MCIRDSDAGRELLVGHLEATVPVDGPDGASGLSNLGAHRRRHREAHRAEATGGDPAVRAFILHELGRPHLVLAHPCHEDRLRTADSTDTLDDVLRGERPVLWGVALSLIHI